MGAGLSLAAVVFSVGLAWAGGVADPALCARCHETQAALAAGGGHAPSLDCVTCHDDRRPGSVGRGHRSIPASCTSHHATPAATHPSPRRALGPARERRACLRCHDPHGSENAHLIRTAIRVRRRLRPVELSPAAPAFVDVENPGRGLCEVCHRGTRFYPASGHGEPHFTGDCTLCHDHAAGFAPVVTDASCAVCHPAEAARLAKPNRHHEEFAGACSSCHAEATPEPGPGHRAAAACADCHSVTRVAAHVPPGLAIPCTQCHEPHGTDNVRLIRDVVRTTPGFDRPVRFTTVDGRADGSFASASAPGTGLCEVCHTRTQFYRADGGGAAHYTTTCNRCHPHAAGFLPR
ncbi:MAG TPA: cytochrome c3 family protein [Candidatus Binatia bacterium]|nr:cytochrome c3 family protein [Candidatus Binatia bacterium]